MTRATKRIFRQAIQSFQVFGYNFVVALLVLQLALPANVAFAADPKDPATTGLETDPEALENALPKEVKDLIAAYGAAATPATHLAIDGAQANVGFLTLQSVVYTETSRVEQLGHLDLNRSDITIPPGLPERALQMRAGRRGDMATLELSLEGLPYVHEILMPGGTQVTSMDWNNERAYFLLSDGTEHVIDVKTLELLMFNTAIPIFHLGVRTSFGYKIDEIKYVKRRNVSPDKSKKALAAQQLDRNPGTLSHARRQASPEVVASLKERLDELRLPPLLPELREQLIQEILAEETEPSTDDPEGPRRPRLTPEEALNIVLNSLQLAEIANTPNGPRVVGIQRRESTDAMIALQDSALMGMQHIASPDSFKSAVDVQNLLDPAVRWMQQTVSTPEGLRTFALDGVAQSVAQLPPKVLQSIKNFAAASVTKLAVAREEGTQDKLFDRFSETALQADVAFFEKEFVPQVEKAAELKASRSYPRNVAANLADRIKEWNPVKRMNQLVVALRKPTKAKAVLGVAVLAGVALAEADYLTTHGANIAASLDFLTATWAAAVDRFAPIFNKDPEYVRNVATYSIPARILMMMSVIGAGAVAKQFSQYSLNKFITINGIKYLFSLPMIPPQYALAWMTARLGAIRAMKQGYLPARMALPFLPQKLGARPLPETHAQQPWYWRTWNYIKESKTAFLERKSAEYTANDRLRAISGALALYAFAEKEGIAPHLLLGKIAGDLKNKSGRTKLKHLHNLKIAALDLLQGEHAAEIEEALTKEPQAFVDMLVKLRLKVVDLAKADADKYPGLFTLFKLQALRTLYQRISTFGMAQYEAIRSPMPTEALANYVVRGFIVDHLLSVVTQSFAGDFANPDKPEQFSYQPGGKFLGFALPNRRENFPGAVFNVNPINVVADGEQTFIHLGAVAALTLMSTMNKLRGMFFSSAVPAAELDLVRNTGVRPWYQDAGTLVAGLFNWRNYNPFESFGDRSYRMCITLVQGFFLVGMGLRLLTGFFDGSLLPDFQTLYDDMGDSAEMQKYLSKYAAAWGDAITQGSYGQFFFIFMAPFVYRWFWAIHQTVTEGLEMKLRGMGGEFHGMYLQLAQNLEQKDYKAAQAVALKIVDLYGKKYRPVPAEVLASLTPKEGQSMQDWSRHVFATCTEHSPAPERPNEIVNTGFTLVGAITTTILASFLMNDSFTKRTFWGEPIPKDVDLLPREAGEYIPSFAGGPETAAAINEAARSYGFDPRSLNIWRGVLPSDSIPSIFTKSMGTIVATWTGGKVFNVAWDAGKIGYNLTLDKVLGVEHRYPNSDARTKAMEQMHRRLASSVTSFSSLPGVRAFKLETVERDELEKAQDRCSVSLLKGTPKTFKPELEADSEPDLEDDEEAASAATAARN